MKTITPQQLRKISTLISQRGIDKETKAAMVIGFSNGRTESSKDLYVEEAALMIRHLEQTDPNYPAAEKMRRKLIYMAHTMGWQKADGNGKMRIDMQRVDEWCTTYGYGKKRLNNYSYKELPKLLSQFEAVYKKFLQSI